MSNLLDSYRSILSHYQNNIVQDLKDKVLGNATEKADEQQKEVIQYRKPDEDFFTSKGITKFHRYFQALYYKNITSATSENGVYGLECNACCIMYMLQNYGLIPPDLTRKEFEQVFTELTPFFDRHSLVSEHEKIDVNTGAKVPIRKKDYSFKVFVKRNPYNNYFENESSYFRLYEVSNVLNDDKIFNSVDIQGVHGATNFFRGRHGSGDIISPISPKSLFQMSKICQNFYNLKNLHNFQFLSNFHKIKPSQFHFKNMYKELQEGKLTNEQLNKYPILIGVYYGGERGHENDLSHFCIVVSYEGSRVINKYHNGVEKSYNYQVYWADDPLFGAVKVYVPEQILSVDEHRNAVSFDESTLNTSFDNHVKFEAIYPNAAIG